MPTDNPITVTLKQDPSESALYVNGERVDGITNVTAFQSGADTLSITVSALPEQVDIEADGAVVQLTCPCCHNAVTHQCNGNKTQSDESTES